MTEYTIEKSLYKGLPYTFRCRVYGKYDKEFHETSPNRIDKNYTDLTDYDGFNYTAEMKRTVNVIQHNTPTISDSGVASGFSNKDFLTIPTAFLPESSTWEIVWRVKTGSSVTTQQFLFGSSTGFYNTVGGEMNSSGKFGVGFSSDGSSWDIGWLVGTTVLTANTWYWLKISFTGTEYKVELSTDGVTYTLENSITSSTPIYQNASTSIIYLGTMGDKSKVWGGSIDLSECSIKTGSQYFPDVWNTVWTGTTDQFEVYDFSQTVLPWKWGYDNRLQVSEYCLSSTDQNKTYYGNQINGTVTGTLTTNSSRMLSGFSSSNYLTALSEWDHGGTPWKIHLKVRSGASTATDKYICGQPSTNYSTPQIALNGSSVKIWLSSNRSSWNIVSGLSSSISFPPDETHTIDLEYTGENYTLSVDGTVGLTIANSTSDSYGNYPLILGFDKGNTAFNGHIYLDESYIEFDGEEVWRGFKKETVPSMSYGKTIGTTNNVYVINGNESLSAESSSQARDTSASNPRFIGTIS